MISIGIAELVLGRFLSLSRTSKILPFGTAAVLGLLVLADDSLGLVMQTAGATTSIIAGITAVILFALDAIKWKSPNNSMQVTPNDALDSQFNMEND